MSGPARFSALRWGGRRRLRFTQEGWVLTFVTVSMGLIAMNTGHNLFYLIFALLLGVVVVSGVLSERVLRQIEVRRHVPDEVTARVPFAVAVEVSNTSRKRYSFSLTINDGGGSFPRRTLGYVPHLAPGQSKTFHSLIQVDKRGAHRFAAVHLVTRFPFGLFEKTRLIHLNNELVAYPGHREASLSMVSSPGTEDVGAKKSRWGEEILSLRPALPEDDYRSIHWRTSARAGSLVAKEFAEDAGRPRLLFFDHRGAEGPVFEQTVENAASLVRRLASQGVAIVFFTWKESFDLRPGAQQTRQALRHLALITPDQGENRKGYEKWRRMAVREGAGLFIRGELPPPSSLPHCRLVFL